MFQREYRIVLALLLILVLSTRFQPASAAATFVVNSEDDAVDALINGICATAGGVCTLRAAIQEANATVALDTIEFSIGTGTKTIHVSTPTLIALPAISNPVIIDGRSQPGYDGIPIIVLDGSLLGNTKSGLFITGGGSTVKGLVIQNFPGDGIDIFQGNGNTIIGNYIGTNAAGTTDEGNLLDGVSISTSNDNVIGGTDAEDRNVISGNDQQGIDVSSATNITIQNNYVGLSAAGTAAIGNSAQGIRVGSTANNIKIGGPGGARNLISGNGFFGIGMSYGTGFRIENNYIGTDVTGMVKFGNVSHGIQIVQSNGSSNSSSIINNLISGNNEGIDLTNGEIIIQGNIIGTNATATAKIPNISDGIRMVAMTSVLIGGTAPGEGNIISGNGSDGIQIGTSTSTTIRGNWIGTNSSGANLGNASLGVYITTGGPTLIGGSANGAGNVIAFNGGKGVNVANVGNPILRNEIYSNGGLGISLAAVTTPTLNDVGDGDTGINNKQNFPVLTSAVVNSSANIDLSGTLNSTASTTFRVEFFSSTTCDPSGYGEGQHYLGFTTVNTNTSGNATFTLSLPFEAGGQITATATDAANNTSEFSKCFTANLPPPDPANAAPAIHYYTTLTPVLTWNQVSSATGYEIQVANNSLFTGAQSYSVNGDELFVMTNTLTKGNWYWRVRALNGTTPGAWSAPISFTIA